MNLLILHAHDMGRYNSAYGHSLPTPRMAEFARESVLFRNAHAAAPTCSPSRAAMLTGRTAHEVGMMGLLHRGWDINDRSEHLAARLSHAGWHTAYAGVQHEFGERCGCPYDEHVEFCEENGEHQDLQTATAASDWLKQRKEKQPFFLWAGFFWPHTSFAKADEERYPRSRQQPPPILPDHPQTREDWAGYAASVEHTDRCMGQILDALEVGGHAQNTVVVITTDHGVPFPFMKCHLTQHGTGVTLMIRDPRVSGLDHCTDALVSHMDLVPTVLELLDLPPPERTHGVSLKSLMEGSEDPVREDLFSEVSYHAAYEPKRSVRTSRWNYIRSWGEDDHPPLSNCDHTRTKDVLLQHGWSQKKIVQEELYDLIFDPQERHNLSEDPAVADVKSEMRERLERWMEETSDPLLNGHIPLSPTGLTNTHDSLHPADGPFEYGPEHPDSPES